MTTASPDRAASGRVMMIDRSEAAGHIASLLELDGVTTVVSADGREALSRLPELAPDVVVVRSGATDGMVDSEVLRHLHDRPGPQPAIMIIGGPVQGTHNALLAERGAGSSKYLPADIGPSELAEHLRWALRRRPEPEPARRPALTEHRMSEEIQRELQRAAIAARPGMLAGVSVAEWEELRRRLGSKAEEALAIALADLLAPDAGVLEQHSARTGDGFFVLMPETGAAAGRDRLRKLSRRMADTVIDVDGEYVRITPVIGYATFDGAASGNELREQVAIALHEANQHLDLLPVRFTALMAKAVHTNVVTHDRLIELMDRLRAPLQVAFTFALLLSLPFIIYVIVSYTGFDLTTVTYPLVAFALVATAAVMWIEGFRAVGAVQLPALAIPEFPVATAIIAAYLPNEAATIVETVARALEQDYPGDLQVILAYNSPRRLPVEETLAHMAAQDPRLLLLRVERSTSKAQNVNAALAYVRGDFVGVFDADHHPAQGSFERAWRWLSNGHDIVQGHCVVRNGDSSWVARLVAVEFETIYAVSHPGRARLHGFGIFGGSNGYWRTESLRQIRMHGSMLTEDIDSSMRSLLEGFSIVSDPELISTELAPTSIRALWNQRMRWAQGWTQTARLHLGPALRSNRLSARQKTGALFLLGWTQTVPWVTVQVIPILAFNVWHKHGFGDFNLLIPLFVLLTIFTLSVGLAQTVFAYILSDPSIKRRRWWFVLFAVNSMLWFGEFKNVISRVAQLKELIGESQWRVTPRSSTKSAASTPAGGTPEFDVPLAS